MANLVSFVILCLLFYGRRLAKRSVVRHSVWMSGVIAADLTLILYLVIARDAMSRLEPSMPWLLYVHLTFAVTTVILYLAALAVGVRLLAGRRHPGAMRALDRVIVPTRVLTLVTSLALQAFATR